MYVRFIVSAAFSTTVTLIVLSGDLLDHYFVIGAVNHTILTSQKDVQKLIAITHLSTIILYFVQIHCHAAQDSLNVILSYALQTTSTAIRLTTVAMGQMKMDAVSIYITYKNTRNICINLIHLLHLS